MKDVIMFGSISMMVGFIIGLIVLLNNNNSINEIIKKIFKGW